MGKNETDIDKTGQHVTETTDSVKPATKPTGLEVGPPGERVDDETGTEEGKRIRRQE